MIFAIGTWIFLTFSIWHNITESLWSSLVACVGIIAMTYSVVTFLSRHLP